MVTNPDFDILERITPLEFGPQQCDFFARHHKGSGQWFLRSKEFQRWMEEPKHTLLCPGAPGVGKTILTSIIVDHMFSRLKDDENIGVAYIYCDHERKNQQRTKDLLASLLKQLSRHRPRLPESVRLLYTGRSGEPPSALELWRALSSVASLFKRVFIVIDGMDEFEGGNYSRTTFLERLASLQDEQSTNLLVTARNVSEFSGVFDSNASISALPISASQEDVSSYLDSRLNRFPEFVRQNNTLWTKIKAAIVRSAESRYLLAQLHVDLLVDKKSVNAIEAALGKLSTGTKTYELAYESAMTRLEEYDNDQKALAKKITMWVAYAKRPLTIMELRTAVVVEVGNPTFDGNTLPELEKMLSVCAGLVAFDQERNVVRLVHSTAYDYLRGAKEQWFPEAEDTLAATCISYLSLDTFATGLCATKEEFDERMRMHPFYRYAARHWGHHVRQAKDSTEAAIKLLKDAPKVEACRQAMERHAGGRFPSRRAAMHIAAYFGLSESAAALIKSTYEVDLRDNDGRTPLSWASDGGHNGVVEVLLRADKVRINSEAQWWERTPLSFAAEKGHESVVMTLIENGAHLDRKDDKGNTIIWAEVKVDDADFESVEEELDIRRPWDRSPLSYAAGSGHENVVKLLVDKGAIVEDATSPKWRPLLYAVKKGHASIIDFLVQNGASSEAADSWGSTPLLVAILHEQKAAVEMLLSKGASPNTPNAQSDELPLSMAARMNKESIVRCLLAEGADVSLSERKAIDNPLSHAAEKGNLAMAKLLLRHGAHAAARGDSLHHGPLFVASRKGHRDIVELLLEAIKKVNSEAFKDLLLRAAQRDHLEVAQCLLERGEDVETADLDSGRSLLSWAAGNGAESVVKHLVEKGADIESMDHQDRTPLWWASRMQRVAIVRYLRQQGAVLDYQYWEHTLLAQAAGDGHTDVVRYFIEEDDSPMLEGSMSRSKDLASFPSRLESFDLETKDVANRTPLLLAVANGREALVEFLLTKRPNVEATYGGGRTALSLAAQRGHANIIQMLVASKADSSSVDQFGWAPLWYAIEHRHTDCALLLLEPSHHIRWTDNEGKTLLRHVAWKLNYAIMERLMQRGGNIDQIERGKAPLAWACEEGRLDIAKLLRRHNASMGRVGLNGRTPLSYAAEKGGLAVVEYLLAQGGQIEQSDDQGRSPLSWAAWMGNKDVARLLLRNGANANGADLAGRTPLWYASWKKDKDIENLLKKAEKRS